VHDRMPVVIPADARDVWLGKDADPVALRALLRPAPNGTFAVRRVSTRVNKPVEDDAGLIEAV